MTNIWSKIFSTSSSRIYAVGISAFVVFMSASILGPEQHGILATALTWSLLVGHFFSLSLGQVSHLLNQQTPGTSNIQSLISSGVYSSLLLALIAFSTIIISYRIFGDILFRNIGGDLILVTGGLAALILLEELARNILILMTRLTSYNWILVTSRTLWLVTLTLYWVVFNELTPWVVLCTNALCLTFAVLLSWRAVRGQLVRPNAKVAVMARRLFSSGVKFHANSVSSYFLVHGGIVILSMSQSPSTVAYYQVALQLVLFITLVAQASSQVLFELISSEGVHSSWRRYKHALSGLLMLITAGLVAAYFAIPVAVSAVLGSTYAPVVDIFRYLLPIAFSIAFAQLLTPQWITRGALGSSSIINTVSAVLSIASCLLLAPVYGVEGVIAVNITFLFFLSLIVQVCFFSWCNRASAHELADTSPRISND